MELAYYGKNFKTIFELALQANHKITMDSEAAAKNFRKSLYNYRYALRDAGIAGDKESQEFYKKIIKLELSVAGKVIRIRPKKLAQHEVAIHGITRDTRRI